jgi:putative peptidoglycan lipid II flippase
VDVAVMLAFGAGVVVSGLVVGNAVSFVLACVIGYALLRRRIGRLGLREVAVSLGRLSLAALLAALPTVLLVVGMTNWLGTGRSASLLQLILGGLVLGSLFVLFAMLLRAREVTEVTAMVRGRLGR